MIVELSDRAIADYLALVENLADFNPSSALSFIEDFERARLALRDFPRIGVATVAPDRRILHFARWYHVEYEVLPNRVVVRRVKDGRRQAD
jgi:plasmid stabilization system protein ParE